MLNVIKQPNLGELEVIRDYLINGRNIRPSYRISGRGRRGFVAFKVNETSISWQDLLSHLDFFEMTFANNTRYDIYFGNTIEEDGKDATPERVVMNEIMSVLEQLTLKAKAISSKDFL